MGVDVLGVLTEAVKSRRVCAMRYRDQLEARIVEPHAIYEDAAGEVIVDCFQVRGYSYSQRTPPFWRPFRVRKIAGAALLAETFEPRYADGFSPSRIRYRKGLLCIVPEVGFMTAPPPPTSLVGPFLLPRQVRR